eukprot:10063376-Lingulodinium_polyedra.AAC.1
MDVVFDLIYSRACAGRQMCLSDLVEEVRPELMKAADCWRELRVIDFNDCDEICCIKTPDGLLELPVDVEGPDGYWEEDDEEEENVEYGSESQVGDVEYDSEGLAGDWECSRS